MRKLRKTSLLLLALALGPTCGGSKTDSSPAASPFLASKVIDSGGGAVSVSDPSSPVYGTQVIIPAGALLTPTLITIEQVLDPDLLPANQHHITFGPAGQTFLVPAQLTIKYSQNYLADFDVEPSALRIVLTSHNGAVEVLQTLAQNPSTSTITGATTHFSRATAVSFDTMLTKYPELSGNPLIQQGHYRLFLQPRALLTVASSVNANGVIVSATGGTPIPIGGGSLSGFWSSKRNLLLIHGINSDPLAFSSSTDLIAGLKNGYDNVLFYQYPSGYSVESNANWLYSQLAANASNAFQLDIVAHSMGGLVARYMLEQLGTINGRIKNLVTIASPHLGSPYATIAANILGSVATSEGLTEALVPGIVDLRDLGPTLTASYVNNTEVDYYLIAGNSPPMVLLDYIPGPDDGLVPLDSALGIPLQQPEAKAVFSPLPIASSNCNHVAIHEHAATNGVRNQVQDWLWRYKLSGVVRNASGPGFQPAPGLTITLTGKTFDDQPLSLTAVSDAIGGFEFRNLKNGKMVLGVVSPDVFLNQIHQSQIVPEGYQGGPLDGQPVQVCLQSGTIGVLGGLNDLLSVDVQGYGRVIDWQSNGFEAHGGNVWFTSRRGATLSLSATYTCLLSDEQYGGTFPVLYLNHNLGPPNFWIGPPFTPAQGLVAGWEYDVSVPP